MLPEATLPSCLPQFCMRGAKEGIGYDCEGLQSGGVMAVALFVCHWSIVGLSLVYHWSVTGLLESWLLSCHWSVTGLSLVCHWSVTGLSLSCHWSVTILSLVCHYPVTGLSVRVMAVGQGR
ncbi:hypothetical protein AV274_4075 [Blastocystis sp. ATCC 50177/Nand II]|uniref:Uncharacterized protein n=1 Tax=Blastocystis sp. subtype 1 (strain ATCC 50177 / NandII) TaxID=478820 RepID=A0A196SDL5_BLAHN|nr:hypothetical protein AV274_4075 [Blastocystis sp. ATCC 50177/Nand II]